MSIWKVLRCLWFPSRRVFSLGAQALASNSALVFVLALGLPGPVACADVVLDWDALMVNAIRADNSGPTLSSRNLAIMHTAIYDAVNSVEGSHQPYLLQVEARPGTSAEAAATAAAYEVMKVLYQPFRAQADALFAKWLAGAAQDASTTNGLALGRQVAEWALQNRVADGASTDVPYIPSDAPGQWRRTPPFFRPPLTPQWRYVRLFCLPASARSMPKR
jgi:hypothetical protein